MKPLLRFPLGSPVFLLVVLWAAAHTATPARAATLELVGFHLGSEYFILTEEINSDDFQARKLIFVIRCSFDSGEIGGLDDQRTRIRIIPEGSTSGIDYTAGDLTVQVTELINPREGLVQIGFPYNVNVLGPKLKIEGSLSFVLAEEEMKSRPIVILPEPGLRFDLDGFDLLISRVEIPTSIPSPLAITFRTDRRAGSRKYSVEFFDEKMQPVQANRSEYVIENVQETTYALSRRPQTLHAIFTYVGVAMREQVDFTLDANLGLR